MPRRNIQSDDRVAIRWARALVASVAAFAIRWGEGGETMNPFRRRLFSSAIGLVMFDFDGNK
jgi:hypothetical protein